MSSKELETNITKAKKPAFNLKAVAHEMERVARLEAAVLEQEPDKDFLAHANLTGLGLFRLVVMGEIKKGKSSFINALLGTKDLVPVHSDVATSTIFKIHYGPEIKYTVYFEVGCGKEKLEIHAAQLTEYGTEDGNPDNEKQVDFIRVESPAALLRNGLIVVDTPGVGGLFKKHREITFRHAPNADAIFFVSESIAAPIGADEVKFLKELRQITELISFVQTKSTKADSEARRSRMANNLSILEQQVGLKKEEISYFIIDSGLKIKADQSRDREDLEDSGFLPLMAYLNNTLRKNREIYVAKAALSKTTTKLVGVAAALDRQSQILDADTEEKRAKLDQEISDLQKRLAEWDQKSKSRILDDLRKGLVQLNREAQDQLAPIKPGGPIQLKCENEIEAAVNIEALQGVMMELEDNLAAMTSQACLQVAENAKSSASELLQKLQRNTCQSLSDSCALSLDDSGKDSIQVNTSAINRVITQNTSDGVFDGLKNFTYGGLAGVTIASIAGGIIGSVVPVVGTIAGSWAGIIVAGLWGGSATTLTIEDKKLKQLQKESFAAIHQAIASAHQAASTQINNLMSDIQLEATRFIQEMVSNATENLTDERKKLAANQKATQQEILGKKKRHDSLSRELDSVSKRLEAFRTSIPK